MREIKNRSVSENIFVTEKRKEIITNLMHYSSKKKRTNHLKFVHDKKKCLN